MDREKVDRLELSINVTDQTTEKGQKSMPSKSVTRGQDPNTIWSFYLR